MSFTVFRNITDSNPSISTALWGDLGGEDIEEVDGRQGADADLCSEDAEEEPELGGEDTSDACSGWAPTWWNR